MSTGLSLRRGTAAQVAANAGQVGELVPDMTNMRATLHDGSTLGGFAQAAISDIVGRNVAINGNFSVNQRGYASGTALAAGAYGPDRFKAGASGCTLAFTAAVPDTTVTITAGSLIQAVDAPNVYATAWWLTWAGTASARVWQGSASGSFAAGTSYTDPIDGTKNRLLVTGLTVGTVTNLEFQGGTFGLVQFEAALPNAGPTRFERRHGELTLCQRYFVSIIGASGYELQSTANAGAAGQGYLLTISLPVTMRVAPTVALRGTWSTTNCSLVIVNPTQNTVLLAATASAAGFLTFNNTAGSGFTASAEI